MTNPSVSGEGSLLRAVGLYTDSIDEARLVVLAVAGWLERAAPGNDQIVGGGYAEFIAEYLRREVETGVFEAEDDE